MYEKIFMQEGAMKKAGIVTLVLSLMIVGAGCVVLTQAITREQNQDMAKTVKNETVTKSDFQKEIGKDENAVQSVGSSSGKEYSIYELPQSSNMLKKSKVDMDVKEAVDLVVKKVELIYGEIYIEGVYGVGLWKNQTVSDEGKNYNCRVYEGRIVTEEETVYAFTVNSVTGEVTELYKEWNIEDYCVDYSEKADKEFHQDEEKYKEIAKKFIKKYLAKEAVKTMEVSHGTIGKVARQEGWSFCLSTANVTVTLENGREYWIEIYPKTEEVVGFELVYGE